MAGVDRDSSCRVPLRATGIRTVDCSHGWCEDSGSGPGATGHIDGCRPFSGNRRNLIPRALSEQTEPVCSAGSGPVSRMCVPLTTGWCASRFGGAFSSETPARRPGLALDARERLSSARDRPSAGTGARSCLRQRPVTGRRVVRVLGGPARGRGRRARRLSFRKCGGAGVWAPGSQPSPGSTMALSSPNFSRSAAQGVALAFRGSAAAVFCRLQFRVITNTWSIPFSLRKALPFLRLSPPFSPHVGSRVCRGAGAGPGPWDALRPSRPCPRGCPALALGAGVVPSGLRGASLLAAQGRCRKGFPPVTPAGREPSAVHECPLLVACVISRSHCD